MPAGQQLVEHQAEAVEVRPLVRRPGPLLPRRPLLGGDVAGGAADLEVRRIARALAVLGEVEVEEHRPAVVGQEDVGRLHIPVDDAPLVGVRQGIGQPDGQPDDGVDVAQALQRGVIPAGPRTPELVVEGSPGASLRRAPACPQLTK